MIHERLFALEEFRNSRLPLLFASFRSEVDTIHVIKSLLSESRPVVLPKVDRENRSLVLFEVRSPDEIGSGYMGIPEPIIEDRVRQIGDVDLVLVPGAGFDAEGYRIGYGGGYYDRLLAGAAGEVPLVSLAYEEQIVPAIPAEPHDRKVKIIVTDLRVIYCS